MNRQEQLETIRAACIRANPDRAWIRYEDVDTEWPVRLADVLWAWHEKADKDLQDKDIIPLPMRAMYGKIALHWNLRKDDLTEQSDETISFLYDILK